MGAAQHMDPVCGFYLHPLTEPTVQATLVMGLWNFHSHLQLCVPNDAGYFSVWSTLLTAHEVGDVLCMYAVKYWGGIWSNIHETLKGEVLQTILDSILLGISH